MHCIYVTVALLLLTLILATRVYNSCFFFRSTNKYSFTYVCDSNKSESKYKHILLPWININRLVPSLASIKRVSAMTRRSICGTAARHHRAERNIFMRDKAISFVGVEGKRAICRLDSITSMTTRLCIVSRWQHTMTSCSEKPGERKMERVRENKRKTVQTFVSRSYSKIMPVTVVVSPSQTPFATEASAKVTEWLMADHEKRERSSRILSGLLFLFASSGIPSNRSRTTRGGEIAQWVIAWVHNTETTLRVVSRFKKWSLLSTVRLLYAQLGLSYLNYKKGYIHIYNFLNKR